MTSAFTYTDNAGHFLYSSEFYELAYRHGISFNRIDMEKLSRTMRDVKASSIVDTSGAIKVSSAYIENSTKWGFGGASVMPLQMSDILPGMHTLAADSAINATSYNVLLDGARLAEYYATQSAGGGTDPMPTPTPTQTPGDATPTPTPTPVVITGTYISIADASILTANPATNYGTMAYTQVRGTTDAGDKISFFKFDKSQFSGPEITSAVFNFYTTANTSVPTTVTITGLADHSWTETGINGDNQPSMAGAVEIGSIDVSTQGWHAFDFTAFANSISGDIISFRIEDKQKVSTDLAIRFKEHSTLKPYIVLEYTQPLSSDATTVITGTTPVDLGATASVTLGIEDAVNVSAQEFRISYDASKLSYIDDSAESLHLGTDIASIQMMP